MQQDFLFTKEKKQSTIDRSPLPFFFLLWFFFFVNYNYHLVTKYENRPNQLQKPTSHKRE